MNLKLHTISGKQFFALFFLLCTYANVHASRENDSLALVSLHEALTFSWNLSQPMTTWQGVQLNADGRVVRLTASPVGGMLPDAIGDLSELNYLDLSDADLAGRIPESITNLMNLTHLNFNENDLEGPIPTNIGNLINLEYLDVSDNFLEEEIPATIWQLTQLKYLSLGDRSTLSGTIPPEIANLINLEQLIITNASLTGGIPHEIGQLTNLRFLYLEDNQLTGSIPAEFGNLSNLEQVVISSNHLTGEIPATITNLHKLQAIYLNDNKLSGAVPDCSQMPMLETLAVANNRLTFAGLEENLMLNNFYYAPQATIPLVRQGEPLVVSTGSVNDASTFDWYKDGTLTTTINGDSLYQPTESGNYSCEVRNVPITSNTTGRNLVLTTEVVFYDIFEGLVFPGDLNRDGTADNIDALHWGLAYGDTGPERPEASTLWQAQAAPDWTTDIAGINGKHQDGDGNGAIAIEDLNTILNNYGETYPYEEKTYQTFAGNLSAKVVDLTVNSTNVLLQLDIYLEGNDAMPTTLHGVAFDIISDAVVGDGIDHLSITSDASASWLGTLNSDLKLVSKEAINKTDIALTRNDGQNAIGMGSICTLYMTYERDAAIPLANELTIAIQQITVLNAEGEEYIINDKKLTIFGLQNVEQNNGLAFTIDASNTACDQLASAQTTIIQETMPPYQYNWSTGESTSTANNLEADVYTLTITDANGTSSEGYTTIEGDGPINIIPTIIHTINGNDNGSIILSVSGGNGDYTIQWDDLQTGTTATSLGVGTHSVEVSDGRGCSQTIELFVGQEAVPAQVQVFLQGPYNAATGMMDDGIREKFLLPLTDPYLNTYQVAPEVFEVTGNDAIVDWLLIELRDDATPKIVQHLQPVLLQRDGDIVGIDGVSAPQFKGLRHGLYNMVISHRNHLAIMSKTPFLLTKTGLIYNFSQEDSYTGSAGFGQYPVDNNIWVMYSGDANQNYEITGPDKSVWAPDNGKFLQYAAADYNLDGDITGSDKTFWYNNNGISSRVPQAQE